MVRRATNSGVDSAATTAADGAAPQPASDSAGTPSFADSQRPLPEGPAAAQQRPDPAVASAGDSSTFEAKARAAGRVAGTVYGAVRDTVLTGADAVGQLTSEKGLKDAADAALGVAARNKGVLAAGAALFVGGLPAVAVTLGAAARTAKLVADGQDPVAAGRQVVGEINDLAERAPERAAEIAGRANALLSGWASRFGSKKKD